jgi:hypothetical protein
MLAPMLGVGFFTYSSQEKKQKKLENQIKDIKSKIELFKKEDPELKKLKNKGLEVLEKIRKARDAWWYLGDMEGIKKKFKPVFRKISPSKVQDFPNFLKLSRHINVSSSYGEAVGLIGSLESTGEFQISEIKIRTSESEDKSNKHKVEFWLSTLQIKQDVIDKLTSALGEKQVAQIDKSYYKRSLRLKPTWKKGKVLVLKKAARDPFINLKRRRDTWLAKLKKEQEEREAKLKAGLGVDGAAGSKGPIDFSDKLILRGVVTIRGVKTAILDAKYEVVPGRKNLYRYNVREGESVGSMRVVSIKAKRVTLRSGSSIYYSLMP